MKKQLVAFLTCGLWIGLSEFVRNELLFKFLWIEKFKSQGLTFPSSPVNNAVWVIWSFVAAGVTVYLVKRLRPLETMGILWVTVFVMMWLVTGNLNVLPLHLLYAAIPLSMLEVAVAVWLSRKTAGSSIRCGAPAKHSASICDDT